MAAIVDTTFLIDVARGDKDALKLLETLVDDGTPLLVPTPVVTEYLAGARRPEADLEDLRASGELLPLTVELAVAAAAIARQHLAKGTFPGWNDILIEAFARGHAAPIVTRNRRHFAKDLVMTY